MKEENGIEYPYRQPTVCAFTNKLLSVCALIIFCYTLYGQGPDTLWTRIYGAADNYDGAWSVQVTFDQNYIVAGRTGTFSTNGQDFFMMKMTTDGDTLWTSTCGGDSADYGNAVWQTSDSGYVLAGYTNSFGTGGNDVYLVRTDKDGDTLWTRTYGGTSGDYGYSVQQTMDKGFIIAGHTSSFGAGGADVYLIKTDSLGDTLWTKTFGGDGTDVGFSVIETAAGEYVITGHTYSFGAGFCDAYVIKTDVDGDTIWTKTFGGSLEDGSYFIQEVVGSGYIISGWTGSFGAGEKDIYLIRIDDNGDSIWTKTYGGSENERGYSVQETTDGGFIVAGYTNTYGVGTPAYFNVYLLRTDANGDSLWTTTYGGTNHDMGHSVKVTADGGYIIAGHTGSFPLVFQNFFNVYVIKTESDPFNTKEHGNEHPEKVTLDIFPNPFSERAYVNYEIPDDCSVTIHIFDVTGRLIKELNDYVNHSRQCAMWDGYDISGNRVPNGIYMLEFEVGNYRDIRKIVFIR